VRAAGKPAGFGRVASVRAVYIGLGGNLGDPVSTLREALGRIAQLPGVELDAVSSAYESAPVGLEDQPPFVNAAARVLTAVPLAELLEGLLSVERHLGRVRTVRYGPRTCDLDILLAGDEVVAEPGLEVPHPRLAERRFALEPLLEIDPELHLPGGPPLRDLLEGVRDQAVQRLDEVALR
jgi:2-amino-4-hydroxy-6-hydroxymethyldihydropteridine diphosphokinase